MIGDQDLQFKSDDGYYIKPVGDFPNKSKYVRVEVLQNTLDYLDENGNVRVPSASGSLPALGSGSAHGGFGGGADGDSSVEHFTEASTSPRPAQSLTTST